LVVFRTGLYRPGYLLSSLPGVCAAEGLTVLPAKHPFGVDN
jgi:hypothetical protein